MTKLRRSIAILLAVIMILPFASFADGEKSDIDGHWAEAATIIVNILEDRQADEKRTHKLQSWYMKERLK